MGYPWLRYPHEDAEVVKRSELIVVGHLDKDSIIYFRKSARPDAKGFREYNATLVVAEVLKGKTRETEIPIIIHYGLSLKSALGDPPEGPKDGWKSPIGIWDTGNSAVSFEPVIKDVTKDCIWFLRRRSGPYGREPGTGKFGVVDPEDVQPLALRGYSQAYLSDEPEKAVKIRMDNDPEVRKRGQRYLDHLEIQRILQIENPDKRVEKLLPFSVNRLRWGYKNEAKDGITACGKAAGPYLLEVFNDPEHERLRSGIIRIWGEIQYEECVDLLIARLNDHDKFWAVQELEPGWWNADVHPPLKRQRQQRYSEMYSALIALRKIGDPSAREAIELTKRRWETINFENPQIVEACDKALKALSADE